MHLLISIGLIVDTRLKPENISGIFFMLPLCCMFAPMQSLNYMAYLTHLVYTPWWGANMKLITNLNCNDP